MPLPLKKGTALFACVALQFASALTQARESAPLPPSQLYGELFHRVQTEQLFADSKTFPDAIAKAEPGEIMRRYQAGKDRAGFSLKEFVATNFELPGDATSEFRTTPREEVRAHVDRLWNALTRAPRNAGSADSHLPLVARYVVPGGRFREMYYWDSYFTLLGLQTSGRDELVADMVENFAGLIDRYGHIPNGSRSYYLSRSQPPFFAAMVELQAEHDGERALVKRLPQLESEYAFWMEGSQDIRPGTTHRRIVRTADGSLLNRYWDDLAVPRDEAYREDIETARGSPRAGAEVYRDLRAAAESGWDFSSRWFADGKTLNTIHTTDFLPVDLNSLLYQLELTIARGCKAAKRSDCDKSMRAKARSRQQAMLQLMWDDELGAFVDYDWRHKRRSARLTAATAFPLFVMLSDRDHAQRVAATIRASLLMPHGLATTTADSGQQWDEPNGWAPLQWIAIAGLRKQGEAALAQEIAMRWVAENTRVYCKTRQARREVQHSRCGRRRGRRVPGAGRLRLDQRRAGQTTGDLSGPGAATLRVHRCAVRRGAITSAPLTREGSPAPHGFRMLQSVLRNSTRSFCCASLSLSERALS